MKKKILFIFLAALCLFFKGWTQELNHNNKLLTIADSIPDTIWKMPMQVFTQHAHQKTITLKNYCGKAIILDFWATWCSSCINHFLIADSLKKEYGRNLEIILVNSIKGTGDTEPKLKAFFANWDTHHVGRLAMPSIIGDTVLKALFPHSFIPHYVWIGADGKIKAITSSEEVTSRNIRRLIDHTELQLPIKKH